MYFGGLAPSTILGKSKNQGQQRKLVYGHELGALSLCQSQATSWE